RGGGGARPPARSGHPGAVRSGPGARARRRGHERGLLRERDPARPGGRSMSSLPIDRPEKIVCVGLNYRDHAEEQGTELPGAPLLFAKWPNALIGPGEPIVIPRVSKQVDYEAELAVVIGERVRRVSEENALDS